MLHVAHEILHASHTWVTELAKVLTGQELATTHDDEDDMRKD